MANSIATTYGMLFCLALALALIMVGFCWLVEAGLRRRIGVWLGYVAMLSVSLVIVRIAYIEMKECSGLFGIPVPFPQCEWSPLVRIFGFFLTFVSMPLLIVSEIKLTKWSKIRASRAA